MVFDFCVGLGICILFEAERGVRGCLLEHFVVCDLFIFNVLLPQKATFVDLRDAFGM